MLKNSKLLGMIGLARRAGVLKSGGFGTEKSLTSGKAMLCLVAEDAAEETKSRIDAKCRKRGIPVRILPVDKETLGRQTGNEQCASVTIEDRSFAAAIEKLIGGAAHE